MDEPTDDSEPVSGQWNPVVATALLLLLGPIAPVLLVTIIFGAAIALSYVQTSIVPAHAASMRIADLETDLTLRFYYEWGNESGRYLYVNAPSGSIRIHMKAYDWAHNGRTSVYRNPDREIAVLGPMGDDHFVSLDTLNTTRAGGWSENWTYLGAFDHVWQPDGGRTFRFINATEQPECIPMRSRGPYRPTFRASARQVGCDIRNSNDPRTK